MRHWKKVDELKDLGCYVRGKFYDLSWNKPVLRAPAVHGVSSIGDPFLFFRYLQRFLQCSLESETIV